MTGIIFLRIALFIYFLSAAGFVVHVARQNKTASLAANYLIIIGFALQSVSLLIRTIDLGQVPILNMAEALSFFGWAIAGAYLLINWKFRLAILGAFASPLTFFLVLAGILMIKSDPNISPIYQSWWLTLHLGTVFGGYGFFGLAFLAALLYLLQEDQIKAKRTGAIYRRLPSLNVLDNMNYYCLTIGFPLMTLGIITGAVLAQVAFGTYWRWDPKEVWTLIIWLVYAGLLHQRLTVGWRGRRAAIMSIIGFTLICFTFIGVSIFLPGYHSFESLERFQMQ